MKRVLFTLVACLVGISSLMAQSFSLPGYLFGRCPDYSITYDKNDAQEQKDVYICDGNKSVVRIDSYKWNSSSSDWVYDGKTVMENDNQGRTFGRYLLFGSRRGRRENRIHLYRKWL